MVDRENRVGGESGGGFDLYGARSLVGGGGRDEGGMAPGSWIIVGTTNGPHAHEEMEMKMTGWAALSGRGQGPVILKYKIIEGETGGLLWGRGDKGGNPPYSFPIFTGCPSGGPVARPIVRVKSALWVRGGQTNYRYTSISLACAHCNYHT